MTVDAYFAELARLNERRDDGDRIRVLAVRPKVAYAEEETKVRSYLDQQLGRRYSVKNYVRGKPYDGIHCDELASSTLNQSGRYDFADCHKLNPQAAYTAVLPTHAGPEAISIPPLVTRNRGGCGATKLARLVHLVPLELPRSMAVLLVALSSDRFCVFTVHRGSSMLC